MLTDDYQKQIKQHVLQRLQVGVSSLMPEYLVANMNQFQSELKFDRMVEGILFKLRLFLAGEQKQVVVVQYPADWWEALKERFAPKWFKKKYPVYYQKIRVGADIFYPLISLPNEKKIFDLYEMKEGK